MIELVFLPSIKEQIENIISKQIETELSKISP